MRRLLRSELIQNLTVIVLVVCTYLLGRILVLDFQKERVQMVLFGFFIAVLLYLILNKRTEKEQVWVIIGLGMLFRIGYMIYTLCDVRSHDLGPIEVNGLGHAGYLLRLTENGCLPETNDWQMYQQPFYYITGAFFSKVINGLLRCSNIFYVVDAAKTVSCAASCISLLGCKRLCEECKVYGIGQKTAVMVAAFLPAYYLTGGRINPDSLAGMFMIYALLYTLRWIQNPGWKNTVILALLYGCGVMTKISCGVVALITATVFLVILFRKYCSGKDNICPLLVKYSVFGLISLPLGLWYGIRNYVKFRQPLTYVLPLLKTTSIYTGDRSLFQRLVWIDLPGLFQSPYVNLVEDCNAPVYYLKSSLFGEFTYAVSVWIPIMLLFCALILSVWVVVSCIWQIRKNREDTYCNLLLLSVGVFYCSMLWFYCKYPFACSMDFRYMIFMPVPLSVILGKYRERHKKNGRWIDLALLGYMVGSCLFYCMI